MHTGHMKTSMATTEFVVKITAPENIGSDRIIYTVQLNCVHKFELWSLYIKSCTAVEEHTYLLH